MAQSAFAFGFTLVTCLSCQRPAGDPKVAASFPSSGVATVVLRAANSEQAAVLNATASGSKVRVTGLAAGGAQGYHPADPTWKETPASEWGMEFVAKRFGNVLVISSKNEVAYIHHHYTIEDIRIEVPPGVSVVRQARILGDSGEPDLRQP